ncbi:MAG: hypothetical protein ACI8U4_000537, partial [Natronomonas sp.]
MNREVGACLDAVQIALYGYCPNHELRSRDAHGRDLLSR